MLKKSKRVNKQLFPHILKKGKVYYSRHFTLRVIQKQTKKDGKVSTVVSKKIERLSVRRNKIRRRFYHALKPNLTDPLSFTGVFFIKKGTYSLSFKDMKDELRGLLLVAQILK